MSVVLVTGGVRSGKSRYAENRIRDQGEDALYIATMVVGDEELAVRVAAHREARPASWFTWETYRGLSKVGDAAPIGAYSSILLDCVTNLLAFTWFDEIGDDENFTDAQVAALETICCAEIDDIVEFARAYGKNLYLVTNEVGWGLVPPSALGRAYRDSMGRLNQHCARLADEVQLLVSGIPVRIK